jgi:rSAM/selenodomain-associated transferase 2
MMGADISIIIPVLNESAAIGPAIERLVADQFQGTTQVIVVDGDRSGSTIKTLAGTEKVVLMTASPGRARQMNAGAQRASGRVVCFLHCDTVLPANAISTMVNTMDDLRVDAGAFDLAIDAPGLLFRIIEKTASFRSRLTRIPYGDQAIFMRRQYFSDLGGFADIPIMEDVDLMQRIKKQEGRVRIINMPVSTSARRWEKEGRLYTTLRNWTLRIFYACGVSPHRLVRFYQNHKTG